jgi:hypothetical protein
MEYWQSNLTALLATKSVKETAQCIPPPDGLKRVCFDKIGVPVMSDAIMGAINCPKTSECSGCILAASGY